MFGVRDSTGTWRDMIPVGYSLTHRPCSHSNCWSMGLGSGLILGLDCRDTCIYAVWEHPRRISQLNLFYIALLFLQLTIFSSDSY
ncbi:Bgt-50033 [Blumeria graminis f. sp. tritici]|uniref:Bgt-50033 n=1 Tax=Blumeria graminis f. sp. tritici TaxID=62690 RepID=A0A9X9L748_BLUGR|nr:Bgt-50033 [Blumeria graminis f. sp. tritici]